MVIKNLTLLGHTASGKSSIIESLAYINKTNKQDLPNSFGTPGLMDVDEEEKKRKTTTLTKVFPIKTKNYKLNLIDTPGFGDFIGEILGGVFASDNLAIVINASNPIEVGTERSWFISTEKTNLPILFIVNHYDKENLNFENIVNQLAENFSNRIIPLVVPIYESNVFKGVIDVLNKKAFAFNNDELKETEIPSDLVSLVNSYYEKISESVAETNEELLNHYLEHGELDFNQIIKGLKDAYNQRLLYPLFTISAKVLPSVKLLNNYLEKILINSDERVIKDVDGNVVDKNVFSALVFKTISDPYKGRVSFIRVFTGKLVKDSTVLNVYKNEKEKVSTLVEVIVDQHNPINECLSGDICAVYKLEKTLSGL